jgi:hypothetical protein
MRVDCIGSVLCSLLSTEGTYLSPSEHTQDVTPLGGRPSFGPNRLLPPNVGRLTLPVMDTPCTYLLLRRLA